MIQVRILFFSTGLSTRLPCIQPCAAPRSEFSSDLVGSLVFVFVCVCVVLVHPLGERYVCVVLVHPLGERYVCVCVCVCV